MRGAARRAVGGALSSVIATGGASATWGLAAARRFVALIGEAMAARAPVAEEQLAAIC